MKLKIMNKKGADKILTIYWFVILTLIAGGIFAMVYVFYSTPYDVRGIEGEIFAERIADCISRQGIIDQSFFLGKDFDKSMTGEKFTKKCNLNFNVEEGYGDISQIQYFYRVEFYTLKDLTKANYSIYDGNINWESDCAIKKDSKDYTRLAQCTEERLYALNQGGEQYLIRILSVVGKSAKNVKS
jgi:hypothetical protein